MKRNPKHDPTSSYYHLIGCIAECMLRCGEDSHHVHDVHDSYEEEMDPPSNVNDTDEDESIEFIVHEHLSENISMDVRESECNIINETLLQNKLIRHTD